MKLIQLELENFRQFERAVIDFEDGMTAIVGANGAGKTTILEAISFALFAKQRDTQDTLRWHWATKGKFSVTLRFQLGESLYEVLRSETKAHLKQILPGGSEQIFATGKEAVERQCIQQLGMTYLRFKNSFCAEQKDLKFLNFERRTDVQQEIARMLGYDRLKTAEELARKTAKAAKDTAVGIRTTLGDPDELKRNLTDADKRAQEALAAIDAARKEHLTLQERLPGARASRDTAENYRKLGREMGEIHGRKDALLSAVKAAKQSVELAEEEAKKLEDLKPQEEAYRAADVEVRKFEALRESHRRRETLMRDETRILSEIADLDTKRASLEVPDKKLADETLSRARQELSLAETRVAEAQAAWETARRSAESLASAAEAKAKELRSQLAKAQEMLEKGKCPECGQPLSATVTEGIEKRKRVLSQAEESASASRIEAQRLQERPKALVEALEHAERRRLGVDEAAKAAQHAALVNQQAETIAKDKAAREHLLTEVRKELASSPTDYDPVKHKQASEQLESLRPAHEATIRLQDAPKRLEQTQQRLQTEQANLDAAVARYKELKSQQTALGIESEEAAEQAIAQYLRLEIEERNALERIRSAEIIRTQCESERTRAQQALAKLIQDLEKLSEQEDREALYDQVGKQMRLLRDLISTQIVPDLVARASENLALLTNGRYLRLELDEKTFAASLIDGDTKKRVISGGEEDVVALSLRLALSELIQERQGRPMSLLILDEVFGSLDPERRQSVLDRLVALRPRFQQILVISHIEEINQVADRCLYVRHDPATHASTVSDVPPQGDLPLEF